MIREIESRSRAIVTIPLAYPVEWHDKMLSEVKLREPSAALFFRLGEPTLPVYSQKGGVSVVELNETIDAYLSACAVDIDSPEHLLAALPLADGRAIRKAILGFFLAAPETTSG